MVKPCNLHIIKTLRLVEEMMELADQGDADREDNGCGILYGVLRDSAYKLKKLADDIREADFAPLAELMANFHKGGGKLYVCSPCFKKRGLDENALIDGAKIVGGAKLVEFLAGGAASVSY